MDFIYSDAEDCFEMENYFFTKIASKEKLIKLREFVIKEVEEYFPKTESWSSSLEEDEEYFLTGPEGAILNINPASCTISTDYTQILPHSRYIEKSRFVNLMASKLPEETFFTLMKRLEQLNFVSKYDYEDINISQIRIEQEALESKNKELNSMIHNLRESIGIKNIHETANFTSENAVSIYQGNIGFTNAHADKPILGSFGASPCVIVAMYNPETKQGLLCHIDDINKAKDLPKHITKISTKDQKLEVHLAGGDQSTEHTTLRQLMEEIQKLPNIEIKTADILNMAAQSLALDTKTGTAYINVGPEQLLYCSPLSKQKLRDFFKVSIVLIWGLFPRDVSYA